MHNVSMKQLVFSTFQSLPAVLELCCTGGEAIIPFACHVVYDLMCLKVIGQAPCAHPELCKKLLWFTRCKRACRFIVRSYILS